jgi:hypothetical protein
MRRTQAQEWLPRNVLRIVDGRCISRLSTLKIPQDLRRINMRGDAAHPARISSLSNLKRAPRTLSSQALHPTGRTKADGLSTIRRGRFFRNDSLSFISLPASTIGLFRRASLKMI